MILPNFSTKFQINNYYQNKPKFNVVYSRINLAKIKDGTYAINLDDYKSAGTHLITLYVNVYNITHFDSYIYIFINIFQKKQEKCIDNKNITTDIYRIQAYDSVMCIALDLSILY